MRDELTTLIRLQELDTRLDELSGQLDRIPRQLQELDAELGGVDAEVAESEAEIGERERRRKKGERDLATFEEKQGKLQGQLFQVKTNAEYEAMLKEIAHSKKESGDLEERILLLMDEIEAEREKLKSTQKRAAETRARIEREKAVLERRAEATREEQERVRGQREKLEGELDRGILSQYERVRRNRGGVAVVAVVAETCTGCNTRVRPQILAEIVKEELLLTCENCHRFVYIPPDSEVFTTHPEADGSFEVGSKESR